MHLMVSGILWILYWYWRFLLFIFGFSRFSGIQERELFRFVGGRRRTPRQPA